jgi:hypothetical protein
MDASCHDVSDKKMWSIISQRWFVIAVLWNCIELHSLLCQWCYKEQKCNKLCYLRLPIHMHLTILHLDNSLDFSSVCVLLPLFWQITPPTSSERPLFWQITPPTSSERPVGSTSCDSDWSFHSLHGEVSFHLICCLYKGNILWVRHIIWATQIDKYLETRKTKLQSDSHSVPSQAKARTEKY